LTDTGEAQQLFRSHHWVFEPGFVVRVVEFVQIVHFEIRVRRSEIFCIFQAIKIVADLSAVKSRRISLIKSGTSAAKRGSRSAAHRKVKSFSPIR
jgi:hypothetical protein